MWYKILDFIKEFFSKISTRTWVEIVVGGIMAFLLAIYVPKYFHAKDRYYLEVENNKAYQSQLSESQKLVYQFQFDIATLRHNNDSVSKKLYETVKRLRISENKVKELQYMHTEILKKDTVVLTDTVFRDPSFKMDTVLGDRWVSTHLTLKYPSTVTVAPRVLSEKEVVVYTDRETVNAPSRCFFIRWFQKKHTVTKVQINEMNPYIESEQNVFIKITD